MSATWQAYPGSGKAGKPHRLKLAIQNFIFLLYNLPMMIHKEKCNFAPAPPCTPVAGPWGVAGSYPHVPFSMSGPMNMAEVISPVPPSLPGPSGVAGASAPPNTSANVSMGSQITDV